MAKKDINNYVNLKSQIATSSLEYATVFNNDGQGGRNIGPEACAPPHTGRGRGRSGAKRNGVLRNGTSFLRGKVILLFFFPDGRGFCEVK